MQRREFIALLGSTAASSGPWPLIASAQTTSKVYRLGTIGPRDPFDDKSPFGSILVRVLAERGYTLGQNLISTLAELREICIAYPNSFRK